MEAIKGKTSISKAKSKAPKSYGNLRINSKDLPSVKDWKLNEDYELVIKVNINELRVPEKWEIDEEGLTVNDIKASFKIIDMKIKGAESKD